MYYFNILLPKLNETYMPKVLANQVRCIISAFLGGLDICDYKGCPYNANQNFESNYKRYLTVPHIINYLP